MSELTNTMRTTALAALAAQGVFFAGCQSGATSDRGEPSAGVLAGSQPSSADEYESWLRANYGKREVLVPMRDGVSLHTVIYEPRPNAEVLDDGPYPIMIHRTPYGAGPYGSEYRTRMGPHPNYARDGYIFVYQDVRGKYLSEGDFVNMTPHVADKRGPSDIDESTDAFDTIAWLLEDVEDHNGRVGMWGISYPGFYSAASMIDAHPNLVAVSPQAPIADWWYDDFHHHGALFLPHGFHFLSTFGRPRPEPTARGRRPRAFEYPTRDGYDFYLDHVRTLESLRSDEYVGMEIDFWNKIIEHPNRDEFWASRDIVPHLRRVAPNVLVVGGWFDAEDLWGPLKIYESVEEKNPAVNNKLVMGPWRHGGWARASGESLGDAYFAPGVSEFYRVNIEQPWFGYHLKGAGSRPNVAEAMIYETGGNRWHGFDQWPPAEIEARSLYFGNRADADGIAGSLSFDPPTHTADRSDSFVSDPNRPVPYTETATVRMAATYMTEDQRFASRRPDVLVYRTEPLEEDITLAGPLTAKLFVSTTGTAADWVVKLIDVHPGDAEDTPATRDGKTEAGYQMMVRSEVIRGRFRNSHEEPEPFVPGEVAEIELPLQDVLHTFKKGHRIMVHVQSTWFPMVDRNPQTYLENPYFAEEGDFVAHTHRVHISQRHPSRLDVRVIDQSTLRLTADPRFDPVRGYELLNEN